jgi:hypothetical protein
VFDPAPGFTSLHKILGTEARARVVDPLSSAAPFIMVALPLLQLAALIRLAASVIRPRRGRVGRWTTRIVAAIVTIVTLLTAFVVVPGQTHRPLLDRVWWGATPDLAASVAVSLTFAAASVVLGSVLLRRIIHR